MAAADPPQLLRDAAQVCAAAYPKLLRSPLAELGGGAQALDLEQLRAELARAAPHGACPVGLDWPALKPLLAVLLRDCCLRLRAEDAQPGQPGAAALEARLQEVLDYLDSFERK